MNDLPPTPPDSIGRILNYTGHRAAQIAGVHLQPHGLTLPQWLVLSALWRQDGLSIGALSQYTFTQKAAMSRLVDRMEGVGLIAKKPAARDARSVHVWLTQQGRALDHLAGTHEYVNSVVLEGFSPKEQEQVKSLLARMLENAERAIVNFSVDENDAK